MDQIRPKFPHRRSIRLKEYDYSQPGEYFVTICTYDRECIFGDVSESGICLNRFGVITQGCWNDLKNHYPGIQLDASVVMPNHIHGIIALTDPEHVGAGLKPARTGGLTRLSEVVRGFKTFSARCINEMRGVVGKPVWQRNYYEHIIRNKPDLEQVREYIISNPGRWAEDKYYAAVLPAGGFDTPGRL